MNSPQLFYRLSTHSHPVSLRESVVRDAVNLLNCALRGASLGVAGDTQVASSVLNFGNPCMATLGRSRVDPQQIATSIRQTLCMFEPRLLASRTTVTAREDTDSPGSRNLYFDVQGVVKPTQNSIAMRLMLDHQGGFFSCVQARD